MTVRDKFRDDLDFEKFRDVSDGVAVAVVGEGTRTEGNQERQSVADDEVIQLLTGVLKELKKTNLHLSKLSDENITNTEVD